MTTDQTQTLIVKLFTRIADPDAFVTRDLDGVSTPTENATYRAARAILAGLEDGSLGYVPAAQYDRVAADPESGSACAYHLRSA